MRTQDLSALPLRRYHNELLNKMLRPQIFRDYETMSQRAAELLAEQLRRKPETLLALATGASPMRAYSLLAERRASEPRLFDRLRILKLDDWGGLAMDDPASSESYLRKALITPLGLESRFTGFNSRPADPEAEFARIRQWLEKNGPIDVCVLGLGVNGHLGFNEPAPALQPYTHVAKLSEASLAHSMVTTARTKPTFGLTLGMADILQSRQVMLLVSGPSKREPVRRLLAGEVTTQFPATFLSLHANVALLCDEAAAGAATSS